MNIMERVGRTVAEADAARGGITFLRWALAYALTTPGFDTRKDAAKIFHERWPRDIRRDAVELIAKSGVTPGTTVGSPLVVLEPLAREFIEYLRSRTVIGQLSSSMRKVPFNIRMPRVTAGASAYWVGQSKIKAASALALDAVAVPGTQDLQLGDRFQRPRTNERPCRRACDPTDMTAAIAAASDMSTA